MKSSSVVLFLLVTIITSCNSETSSKKNSNINQDSKDTIAATFKMLSNDSLIVLLNRAKRFAEEYKPVSNSKLGIALLANIPDSIVYSYKQLRIHGNNEYGKYLTLVFLKIYRTHLRCCRQGYELRNHISKKENIDSLSDPLLYEFNLISKLFDNSQRIEFINSGIPHIWVEKNKKLLEYDRINKEYKEIEKISKNILTGIYQ